MIAALIVMALAILGLSLLNLWQARHPVRGVWIWTRARLLIEQAARTNCKTERILAQMRRLREELENSLKAAQEAS